MNLLEKKGRWTDDQILLARELSLLLKPALVLTALGVGLYVFIR